MHIKFIRINRSLNNSFTKPIRGGYKNNILKSRLSVNGEHDSRATNIASNHLLNTGRNCYVRMNKSFMNTIRNCPIIIKRCKDLFNGLLYIFHTMYIKKTFLLSSKRSIWKVLSCGGGPNRKRCAFSRFFN